MKLEDVMLDEASVPVMRTADPLHSQTSAWVFVRDGMEEDAVVSASEKSVSEMTDGP